MGYIIASTPDCGRSRPRSAETAAYIKFWVTAAYGTDAHLRLRTNLNETSIVALQDFAHFLHRWKFIPNAVNVRNWIDARALEAVLTRGVAAA